MLNGLWLSFFWLAAIAAGYQWLLLDNAEVFSQVITSLFSMAKLSAEIAIGLIGTLCLWLGIFKIAEKSQLISFFSRGVEPLFRHLMPGVPRGDKAFGSISMNMAANMLGLDNAATPLGLKAMQDLQEHNTNKDVATNAQILFLVLNTSSVTLLPVTIFMYRAQQGALNPTEVFMPILLATCASTVVGLSVVAWIQRLSLLNRVVLSYLAGFILFMSLLITSLISMPAEQMTKVSSVAANIILFGIILAFLTIGWRKGVQVYDTFIEGAKEGFTTAITLIPYLVAMLVAIGVLRASGALDLFVDGIAYLLALGGLNTQFVDALPTALMKPFSGSGARAMMLETMNTHGVDSFAGRLAAVMQGSTETTFYVLAVYFGVVGIKQGRHAVFCGLLADLAGICAAIIVCYWFFG